MTVNTLLIGALATLLVFAIAMSNVAFGEKTYGGFAFGGRRANVFSHNLYFAGVRCQISGYHIH